MYCSIYKMSNTWEIFLCKHYAHICRNAIKSTGTDNVDTCTYSLVMELKLHFLQELKPDTVFQYLTFPCLGISAVAGYWQKTLDLGNFWIPHNTEIFTWNFN